MGNDNCVATFGHEHWGNDWPIPIHESADLLGVDYFSVYRLIQRGKLRACRALRGKLLVPRSELLRLLNG